MLDNPIQFNVVHWNWHLFLCPPCRIQPIANKPLLRFQWELLWPLPSHWRVFWFTWSCPPMFWDMTSSWCISLSDYHLITKTTTFNIVTISLLITKTINVVKIGTCQGNCRGTFWHRRIRRASTIYQAETIIIPLMIKTTMMMMKFKVDDEVWVMIDIKVVGWKYHLKSKTF